MKEFNCFLIWTFTLIYSLIVEGVCVYYVFEKGRTSWWFAFVFLLILFAYYFSQDVIEKILYHDQKEKPENEVRPS